MAEDFDAFMARVRAQVEARLEAWLDARVAAAREQGRDVFAVADGVRELTLRGGKRLRPVLLAAGYVACGGADAETVTMAGVALELFQTYLLAHDDFMDGDAVRRGGPSLPALMRAGFAQHADAMAILAGDLACAWAQRALLEVDLPAERVLRASRELAKVHDQVVAGQVLDVVAASGDAPAVEAVHALKTASYTVRGPVLMGAHLAGGTDEQVAALTAFAEPLGVAFQLRDDVLGTFGDAAVTGKPTGNDLREGKRTALVVEALADVGAGAALARVLGRRDADGAEIQAAMAAIEACGARARIEARTFDLADRSREALEHAPLTPGGRALLERAAGALTERRG
ncbi:MAG TPA: polyprenyl synthetase family protein [Polyangiaceae bacterium]|jgi:geranylgeranyl diphosphate synthase type I|nr:polyprenyl synthetase family protein [Polyangiaceae bacterium]